MYAETIAFLLHLVKDGKLALNLRMKSYAKRCSRMAAKW